MLHLIIAAAMPPSPLPVAITNFPASAGVEWPMYRVALWSLFGNLILALVTGLLFWFTRSMATATRESSQKTAEMAKMTAELAADTVDAANRADEHHQQSLWPLLVIKEVTIYVDHLEILISNVGGGPSLRSFVTVLGVNGGHDAIPYQMYVSFRPLAPNESETINLQIEKYNAQAPPGGLLQDCVLSVDYSTLFETSGKTTWNVTPPPRQIVFTGHTAPTILKRVPSPVS